MKIQKNLLISCLALLLIIGFNNCANEDKSQNQASIQSQCLPQLTLAKLNKSESSHGAQSPFSQEKLQWKIGSSPKLQKAKKVILVGIYNNKCLKNFDSQTKIAKEFLMDEFIDPKLSYQPYKLEFDVSRDYDQFRDQVNDDPCLLGVSELKSYRSTSEYSSYVNDPLVEEQNHLDFLKLKESHKLFYDAQVGVQKLSSEQQIVVAVVDSGVDMNHPDLKNKLLYDENGKVVGVNVLQKGTALESIPDDVSPQSHGTHVSGIIAAEANNSIGVTGLASLGVKIMPIRAFDSGDSSSAPLLSSNYDIYWGIRWAIENEADIINLSVAVIPADIQSIDPIIKTGLMQAIESGIFVATGAGNANLNESARELNWENNVILPALYGQELLGLITTGSVDSRTGDKSFFSLFGANFVEIAAPGAEEGETGILSTAHSGSGHLYHRLWGTSQASPMVAAAGALTKGILRSALQRDPSPEMIEDLILESARRESRLGSYYQDGRVLDFYRLAVLIFKTFEIPTDQDLPDFCVN